MSIDDEQIFRCIAYKNYKNERNANGLVIKKCKKCNEEFAYIFEGGRKQKYICNSCKEIMKQMANSVKNNKSKNKKKSDKTPIK